LKIYALKLEVNIPLNSFQISELELAGLNKISQTLVKPELLPSVSMAHRYKQIRNIKFPPY